MFSYKLLIPVCFAAAIISCKKETEFSAFPYKSIRSFSIEAAAGEKINGAIDGDSIIIYWPSYTTVPATIAPQITVSENATVSPASGAAAAFETGTPFTVKAQDGSVKTYFLKVQINQPPIILRNNNYATVKGGTITVSTTSGILYIARDPDVTSFSVVDSTGAEKRLPIRFFSDFRGEMMEITVPETDDIKIGAYRIKVTSGAQTYLSTDYMFGILYPSDKKPVADPVNTPVTVKRGNTITFTGTGFIEMKEALVYGYTPEWEEKEVGTLELVSFTATSVTYRVPPGFPTGVYELGGFDANGIGINLRTTDFIGFWSWSKPAKVYVPVEGSTTVTITE